jgi:hypothetical protein
VLTGTASHVALAAPLKQAPTAELIGLVAFCGGTLNHDGATITLELPTIRKAAP